ncbi:hypothetical protein JL720_6897 [Aureococcus anophagefferens]|nr:hypothetical protein JL720_6897 [Aureococcus anophagefferens]
MGAIGIALNGVQFYGGAVERTDDDDPGCELLDRPRGGAPGRRRLYRSRPARRRTSRCAGPKPPASDYPFTFRCYRGCVWSDLVSETNRCTRGSAGVADDYVPRKAVGYTDKYVSAEATAYWYAQNGDDAMAPLCASEPTAAPTTATWAPTTEAHLKICAAEAAGQRAPARPPAACATPRRPTASATAARSSRTGVALRGPRRRVLRVEPHVRGGRGGVFLANLCGDGAADADEPCGCCVRMPSAAPTWARAAASAALADDEDPGTAGFNSLYVILVLTFMSLVIFSLAAVGKFQYDKLKALEHKTERHRMSTRTRTEMVAAPAVV